MKSTTLLLLIALFSQSPCFSQGSAFTYQGELKANGGAANGNYDLRFTLWDAASGPSPVGGPVGTNAVPLTNGLFTVTLDFGPEIFTGGNRWLEINVRTNGAGTFDTLTPRQVLTATPYAITARNVTGVLHSGALAGSYSNAVAFTNSGSVFNGNGSGLTNVNAQKLDGLAASDFWRIGGNAGTTAGVNFLGTIDNQPLEFKVNGERAFRMEPTIFGANVIGGARVNEVARDVMGATIAGGGAGNLNDGTNRVLANFGTVGGGMGNTSSGFAATISGGADNTSDDVATVGGGVANTSSGSGATIGGGHNNISSGAGATVGGGAYNISGEYGTVAGGHVNTSSGGSATVGGGYLNASSGGEATVSGGGLNMSSGDNATIGGGRYNTNSGLYATIGGGLQNKANGYGATIGGGYGNLASTNYATIGGGLFNAVRNGLWDTISGGVSNYVTADGGTVGGGNGNGSGFYGTVGGGHGNSAGSYGTVAGGIASQASGDLASVGGGSQNFAQGYASTVGGGLGNFAIGAYSAVPGGYLNTALGNYSFAAGRRAQVTNDGSFVWADSQNADFFSTMNNQFSIRAAGGVRLNTDTELFWGTGSQLRSDQGGAMELGNSLAASTPYIDFHYGTGSQQDFNVRIINDGNRQLSVFQPDSTLRLMRLYPGGMEVNGTFVSTSDRNVKAGFEPVDSKAVLEKLAALPITRWHYTNDVSTPHIGPVAQDFHAAFGVGLDEKHIATVDADGVALAAIQGLNQKLEEKEARIRALERTVAQFKEFMTRFPDVNQAQR